MIRFFIILGAVFFLPIAASAQTDLTYTYGTYFGQFGDEYTRGMECSEDGQCFLYGSVSLGNFYTLNAFQEDFGGFYDGFFSLFSTEGDLTYSSFIGGSELDVVYAMDWNNGHYVVAGNTESADFPVSENAFQNELRGDEDVFIALFTEDHELVWSTYYGGDNFDDCSDVILDDELNVYILGGTSSPDLATTGVYQESFEGAGSGYLTKFAFDGSIVWSTYTMVAGKIGISQQASTVVVMEGTQTDDGIAQDGHQMEIGGELDAFVAVFDMETGTLNWSTYFGGEGFEFWGDLYVSETDIFISGQTSSDENIATSNAYKETKDGFDDGFVARFDMDGNLVWSTYFGGEENDGVSGLDLVGNSLVMIGGTTSNTGIAFGNPLEPENESTQSNNGSTFLGGLDIDSGYPQWGTYIFSACQNLSLPYLGTTGNERIMLGGRVSPVGDCTDWATDDAFQDSYFGGEHDAALVFFDSNVLNVDNPSTLPLEIWPNPTTGILNYHWPLNIRGNLKVFDVAGRIAFETVITPGSSQIQLNHLSTGMHLVQISSDDAIYRSKFVKMP